MATQQYLATLQTIKELTAITDNSSDKHIVASMLTAQDLKLKPVLGILFQTELLDQLATKQVVAAASNSNPIVITTDNEHGFTTGDSIRIADSIGMKLDGQYTITVTSNTEFELDGIDGTTLGTYDIGSAYCLAMSEANWNAMQHVTKAYAWWTFREAIPFIRMHFVNSGMQQQGMANASGKFGGDGGVAASIAEMKWYDSDVQNKAEQYTAILIQFLCENEDDYPNWRPTCTNKGASCDTSVEFRAKGKGYSHRVIGI